MAYNIIHASTMGIIGIIGRHGKMLGALGRYGKIWEDMGVCYLYRGCDVILG
jgi:hypothetical protein